MFLYASTLINVSEDFPFSHCFLVLPCDFKAANGKPGNVAANEDEDNDGTDLGKEEVSSTPATSQFIQININKIVLVGWVVQGDVDQREI